MAEPRIDENGLPVYAPGDYDYVRVVDRSTGASRNAMAPEVTSAARALSGALAQIVADAQEDIAPVIAGLGYLPPVPFASGLNVDSSRFTVSHGGEVYAPVADALPFTTTGTFNPAQWRVIQGIVGADLLSDTGASMVAMKQAGATTYQRTVAAELLDRVSILRFIPPALHAGIRNGGGTTDLRAYVQNAVDHCVQNGRELYCPAGVYVIDTAPTVGNLVPIHLMNTTTAGQGIVISGEGRGKTIFREAAGATSRGGRFTKMFYGHYGTPGQTVHNMSSITFRDITFDKNGRSNGPPPNLYEWEQAHIVSFAGGASRAVESVTFERCSFVDKVGGAINFSSSTGAYVNAIRISDCQSVDHPNVDSSGGHYGQRGDFEFGIYCTNIILDGCTALYSQIEPTTPADVTRQTHTSISGCVIDVLEFTSGASTHYYLDIANVWCRRKLLVRGVKATISKSRFAAPEIFTARELVITDSVILIPYDAGANSVTPFTFAHVTGAPAGDLIMANCRVLIDSDNEAITPTGYGMSGGSSSGFNQSYARRLTGVVFDPRLEHCVLAYSNGRWVFDSCEFAARSIGLHVGGNSTNAADVTARNCDFSKVQGAKVHLIRSNDLWRLRVSGSYNTASWSWGSTGSGALDDCILTFPTFYGKAAPTGFWPRGARVENIAPSAGGAEGWIKTATDSTSGTWKAYGSIAA